MSKLATNIIKGVIGRIRGQKKKAELNTISWVQEKVLKHQEDKNEKSILLNNTTIFYKRPYELLHTYKDIFGNEIYKFITSNSSPLIIDCGSNIGISVLYFKKLYPSSRIIAFEPDKNIFQLLKKNILANDLKDIELNQAAVWIKNGEITFSANESEASHISDNKSSLNTVQVETKRLANYLSSYDVIDFLKIDIEGAEWQVIKDCLEHLYKVQNMFLEYHGKVGETNKLVDLLSIVHNSGFSTYIKNAADNLDYPFVNKSTNTVYDVQLNIFCYK